MNGPVEPGSDRGGNMDDVGSLIELVGVRDPVPDDRFERARKNVCTHWQQVVADQRVVAAAKRPNNLARAASALLVFVSAAYVFWNLSLAPRTDSLASIDRVLGEVLIAGHVAGENRVIDADSSIVTGVDGRIALRMSGGQSLRIDSMSHVVLHSANHLSLQTGAVYIDTAAAKKDVQFTIATPLGTARDIGTQFQVRMAGVKLLVGVREGLVEVLQPSKQDLSIDKGHYVELEAAGVGEQRPMESDDPAWDWVETIAPEFDIQGATLAEYLVWYARERGLELLWLGEESEANATAAVLAGSTDGASLDESLEIVMEVAPFEYQVQGQQIWVTVD